MPLARRGDDRRRFGRLRLRAAEVEEVPVDADADVPRFLPLSLARKDARVRIGVVDAAGERDRRLRRGQRRLLPRLGAAHSKRQRLPLRPCVERLLDEIGDVAFGVAAGAGGPLRASRRAR